MVCCNKRWCGMVKECYRLEIRDGTYSQRHQESEEKRGVGEALSCDGGLAGVARARSWCVLRERSVMDR
jgi:hypothetical protein